MSNPSLLLSSSAALLLCNNLNMNSDSENSVSSLKPICYYSYFSLKCPEERKDSICWVSDEAGGAPSHCAQRRVWTRLERNELSF